MVICGYLSDQSSLSTFCVALPNIAYLNWRYNSAELCVVTKVSEETLVVTLRTIFAKMAQDKTVRDGFYTR